MAPDLVRPMQALAYVNHSRWVADCPNPQCTNADELTPGQFMFTCVVCHLLVPVQWPPPQTAHEIWLVLAERKDPENRNWFPQGHPLAIASGRPHGLTPRELADETDTEIARLARLADEHEAAAAHEAAARLEVERALEVKRQRNEKWAADGHPKGGPLFHPEADADGFPPGHAVTRGPKGGGK